jgi:hypothetical protein
VVLVEPAHPEGVTTIEPPFGSRRVLVKLTVASTSIEFGPRPLDDFGESDPNVSGVSTVIFHFTFSATPSQACGAIGGPTALALAKRTVTSLPALTDFPSGAVSWLMVKVEAPLSSLEQLSKLQMLGNANARLVLLKEWFVVHIYEGSPSGLFMLKVELFPTWVPVGNIICH